MQHLLTLNDLTTNDLKTILNLAADLKKRYLAGERPALYPGHVLALLFEKQSLRTRVSFEAGMAHLGGGSLMLGEDTGFGSTREAMCDFAAVLTEMVDLVVLRTKKHATVEEFAKYSSVPVINGLTDFSHPCQAITDLFTASEVFGNLQGRKIAWIGDANNVARSLAMAAGMLGMEMTLAAPEDYQFSDEELDWINANSAGMQLEMTDNPAAAAIDASVIYTDVWVSMGQEKEKEQRKKAFADYQVTSELMKLAEKKAIFMHCLPANRGEEVTDEVIDSPASVVVQQAGNRMHAQKGILAWLFDQE